MIPSGCRRILALSCALLMVPGASLVAQQTGGIDKQLSTAGADTCVGCHNGADMLVIFRTPHGVEADPESPMASLQCEACHGPGGEHSDRRITMAAHQPVLTFGSDSDVEMSRQNAICTDCHAADVTHSWQGSVHERNDVGCVNCHRVHASVDAVTTKTQQNRICFDCHRRVKADSMKPSSHPLRTDEPLRVAAMVCTDCHNPHAATAGGVQLVRATTNQVCYECHAEIRGPTLFEHAPVSEDCSLCHEPHGSIHAPLLTQRPPLLCQSCHSQAGHPSISFTDNSLPGGTPSSMVLQRSCMNCHTQVHGSNHPSGYKLMR